MELDFMKVIGAMKVEYLSDPGMLSMNTARFN